MNACVDCKHADSTPVRNLGCSLCPGRINPVTGQRGASALCIHERQHTRNPYYDYVHDEPCGLEGKYFEQAVYVPPTWFMYVAKYWPAIFLAGAIIIALHWRH